MRAKFVDDAAGAADAFTFTKDSMLTSKFDVWLPALLDVLADAHGSGALRDGNIPAAMRQWKGDLVADRNPVADWLEQALEVTGLATDFATMPDLKRAFYAVPGNAARVKERQFSMLVKGHVAGKEGVTFLDNDRVDGERKTTRGVIRGVRPT